jgi:hypothetical protein
MGIQEIRETGVLNFEAGGKAKTNLISKLATSCLAGAEIPARSDVQYLVVQMLGKTPRIQSWRRQLTEVLDERFSLLVSVSNLEK